MSEARRYPPTVTPTEAEVFFRQPANFVGKDVEAIYQILGYPNEWGDWDLGRVVCAWRNSMHTVRVYTESSGHINCVELVKPRFRFWPGRSTQQIWRKPEEKRKTR